MYMKIVPVIRHFRVSLAGGALWLQGIPAVLINVTFVNNTSGGSGGALRVDAANLTCTYIC